jgi:TatD DNase family protein
MNNLVDTHAHIYWDSYETDLDQVLDRCVENGVTTIVNVGVDVTFSQKALDQISTIQQFNNLTIYSSIAIHPEEAIKYYRDTQDETRKMMEEDIKKLENIYLQNPEKVIAVGECGLDFDYFTRDGYLPENISIEKAKELQIKLFQMQIDLAKKLNLPLLLHIRDNRSDNPDNTECWDQALEMTKDHYGILHCYSGLMPTTKKALDSNFLVSFAGNVTYKKNEYLREAIKFLPLEKIVLETDCPFLAPQSIRGQRNEPSSVKEVAQLISELKDISFEKVATQTTQNFLDLIKKT